MRGRVTSLFTDCLAEIHWKLPQAVVMRFNNWFFLKRLVLIADGLLQHVHNLGSVKTAPVTSYIEILQNVVLYLFNGGE